MEQSIFGETLNGRVMPQLPGSACAAATSGLTFDTTDMIQLHAALLSAVVDAEDAKLVTPLQQAVDGLPLPIVR